MARWDDKVIKEAYRLHHVTGYTQTKIGYILGVPVRTISNWLSNSKYIEQYSDLYLNTDVSKDGDEYDTLSNSDLQTENVVLAKKVQRLQDANRIERKSFREYSRVDNTLESLSAALLSTLKTNKFTSHKRHDKTIEQGTVGVVHLSDLHFNELISDIDGNQFDFNIASKRLQKYVKKAKAYFKANNVKSIGIFLTGDLLNSDRRLSEITSAATNRSKAIFLATDILQQVIKDFAVDYNVTVASVTGNESRVGEYVEWSSLLASDSYDVVIHNLLTYLFVDDKRVRFINVVDPLECVVDVNGVNFLLVHGHGHKGLANTQNIEKQVMAIKARYAGKGIKIDFVICGHIHSAYLSDNFARNSGLPGTNSYAERGLNLMGKSSQNIHLVWEDGTIDSVKIDLQQYDDYEGYDYNKLLESYYTNSQQGNVAIIQQVLI